MQRRNTTFLISRHSASRALAVASDSASYTHVAVTDNEAEAEADALAVTWPDGTVGLHPRRRR